MYAYCFNNPANKYEPTREFVISTLVGAVIGGAIGGFVRYGVGVALGAKTSSGLVIKSVSRSLSSVSRNTIHHIMQSKHAWGRVFRNATWKNVKGLINTTIKKVQRR